MSTRLLQPFARFGGVFLFLSLEVISFYLVVSFNTKQNQIYLSSTNTVTGAAYDRYDAIVDYFSLKKQIQDLQAENVVLRNRLDIAQYENISTIDTFAAGNTHKRQFEVIPAKIISNFYANSNNMLTINRGRNQDVVPDMGVIDGTGIIGITRQVSNDYAVVMSLFHNQTQISAKLKKSNAFGTLEWDGKSPGLMDLNAIPKHDIVAVGDTIITSGYASHFPAEMIIGVIDEISLKPGSNFYSIKVKLVNDLRKVKQVYVVKNLMLNQIDSLQQDNQ